MYLIRQHRNFLAIAFCRCIEGSKNKCAQYWPDGLTQTFASENCSVVVTKESEESFGDVIRRQLKIHPSSEASVGGSLLKQQAECRGA